MNPGIAGGASPQSSPEPEVKDDDKHDTEKQDDLEMNGNSGMTTSATSPAASIHEDDERVVVTFSNGDPANPYNWSRTKKLFVVFAAICMVMNSTIGSSIASGATEATSRYFGVNNQAQLVLPVSIYLIGYVLGPLVFAVR